MAERKVSVRIAAVGGDQLKADLVAIGRDGQSALKAIESASVPAGRGLTVTGDAAGVLMTRLDALAARASAAANTMRSLGGAGTVVARINQTTGVSSGIARDAADIEAYGRALDDARAKHDPMFAAIRQYRKELADIRQVHAVGAISADEMNAAISRTRQASLASIAAIKGRTTAIGQMASGSRLAAMQSRMLLYQLNDIGVSLAGGMSPLMVLVQQGSQVAQMYAGAGGVNAALKQTGELARGALGGIAGAGRGVLGLVRAHPLLAAGTLASAAAFAGLRREINATSEVQVSFGDTALAVWQTIRDGAWSTVKPAFDAIGAWAQPVFAAVADWAQAAWDAIVEGVRIAGNAIINGFRLACETVGRQFMALPSVIGAAAIGAANAVLAGVERLLTSMTPRINEWIAWVNASLSRLPDWALPDWAQIPEIPTVTVGRIENPYVADLKSQWADYRQVAEEIMSSDPLGGFFDSVSARARANARARKAGSGTGSGTGTGGSGGGSTGGRAGVGQAPQPETPPLVDPEEELRGIAAITDALNRAYEDVRDLGKGIGEALVGGFQSAEQAVGEFVRTGKLDIRSLVTSTIADFAQLGARRFLFAPLSSALSTALGGLGGSQVAAVVQHAGGIAGSGPLRMVDAANFINAPRLHGGTPASLRADEYAAILQRGERVLNRRETRDYERGRISGGPVVNINVRDAASFRQSRTQVAADIARAIALGRRGM